VLFIVFAETELNLLENVELHLPTLIVF